MLLKRLFRVAATIFGLLQLPAYGLNPDGFEQGIHTGHVFARAIVKDKEGYPLWAEYNQTGGHTQIPVGGVRAFKATVIAGTTYRHYIKQFDDFKKSYNSQSELLTFDQYNSLRESNSLNSALNQPIKNLPQLPADTKVVAIPPLQYRGVTDGEQLPIKSFPIDLLKYPTIDDGIQSLLVAEDGEILYQSQSRIGYLTAFGTKSADDQVEDSSEYKTNAFRGNMQNFFAPIPGVSIESITGYVNGYGVTDENGRYTSTYRLSPCPGFSYTPTVYSHIRLYYNNFNPRGKPTVPYYIQRLSYDNCNGMGAFPPGYDLAGLSAQQQVRAMVAASPENVQRIDIPVGVHLISGLVVFNNVEITEDKTTSYSGEASAEALMLQTGMDYDGDGKSDNVYRGKLNSDDGRFVQDEQGDLQGVYLSGSVRSDYQPNFTKLIDKQPHKTHQGLLKTINKEDLANTDIYVFRESTGELITERVGLSKNEANSYDTGVSKNNSFFYQMMVRSPEDLFSTKRQAFNDWNDWQAKNKMNPALFQRKADHLRTGEPIRVIAINRATGYIGTALTTLGGTQAGGDITSPVPTIILSPPNLKVWATRRYQPQGAKANSDAERHNIGNEGAALTSDYIIEVHTEWLDDNDRPLPAELEGRGYTARLAKVVLDPSNSDDPLAASQIHEIAIDPGRRLQLVKFTEGNAGNFHYYFQVNGNPIDRENDFSSNPDHNGVLKYRPKTYVPLKVQLYDETSTLARKAELQRLDKKDEFEPIYHWVYRPELQFSVYDLEIDAIRRKMGDDKTVNIYGEKIPVISSSDNALEVAFDLISPAFNQLETIDGKREFVLAMGEQEYGFEVKREGSEQTIVFNNIEHLSEIEPEDYLTLRLFLNNDASNILWEYAFEYLYIEPTVIGYENQTESVYYVTADNPKVELKAAVAGYAYREKTTKQPIQVVWQAKGDGSFDKPIQSNADTGMFDNTLTMKPAKGASADVSVALIDGSSSAYWKTVEVLAGKPHHLTISTSGQAVTLKQGSVKLDVYVYDQHNNLVEDGTEVQFEFGDNFLIQEQQLETVDGHAYIVLTGGEYATEDSVVKVLSGPASKEEHLSIEGLNVAVTADTVTLAKQQSVTVTATVTKPDGSPVVDVPVSFSAVKGLFANQEQLTNEFGIAQTQFTAGLNELTDTWVAQVGYVGIGELNYTIQSNGGSIDALDAMLVADESVAGDITYDHYGVMSTIGYQTQGTVDVRVNSDATVIIGDMADPNLEPLVSLAMNRLTATEGKQIFEDAHKLNHATAEDITIVRDHPLGAGRSAQFNNESRVTLKANSSFNLTENIGFRLDIKPMSDGVIVDHAAGAQRLSYNDNTLSFRVTTDTGTFTIQAPDVANNSWHRVATRVANNTLELFVDDQVYSKPITGSLKYSSGTAIVLGGLDAVIRSFRLYDWNSLPLITFADGKTAKNITTGTQTLTIKSLGNLGKLLDSSQLRSLRVAIITGDQRNYASLLTKRGYQEVAQQYLRTTSPQTPFAFYMVPNPLSGLVPTAHAWSWDGVWESAKSAISYIIPYEDFIVIGEQLIYLMNRDWENFDATKLAFASIGAATIIPIAKPLKPLLTPLKKVVNGMKRFPGAKHFAGAVGTAVKAGLSGKTEKLENLLPFILIAVELYQDPEVFEFMMNAIESEDDLWVWINFIATVVEVKGGLNELANIDTIKTDSSLPLSWVFSQAYAADKKSRKLVGQDAIKILKIVEKNVKNPKKFTNGLKQFLDEVADSANAKWKPVVKSGNALRYLTTLGGQKIREFLRNSHTWRVNRWVVLASLVYLAEEQQAGRLGIDKEQWAALSADVFSGWALRRHGAMFQLSQIAYYHLHNQYAEGVKILGIEVVRPGYLLVNGERLLGSEPYKRRIDIVLDDGEGGEHWIETKSLAGPYLRTWFEQKLEVKSKAEGNPLFEEGKYRSYFRQFFHDMRLNKAFINNKNKSKIIDHRGKSNGKYSWYFHDFKTLTSSKPPTTADIKIARNELCEPPNVRSKEKVYQSNLNGTIASVKLLCKAKANNIVRRNTKDYFAELLEKYASQLEIQDVIKIAREIGVD
ncbi:Ig-like domain-containing protein [Spartinivicinus poritis]|uniref:Uncharacterized protein n=1 Tax=Spartinivicinus poritis TaxID=2994640 RepID=A0ABT5U927_9GAMM|nr:Ig-like domain-containing protein [Spartinivicinus sp. A2-2]MDE1462690.1 hypothetical protein [Spartinivicinus sp. A2-2]